MSHATLQSKLKAAKTLNRETLKAIITEVHGGKGKNKLSPEDVRMMTTAASRRVHWYIKTSRPMTPICLRPAD